ncbi:MAG: polyribonucleotide nucleotidyltransferase [Chloroflexi bacterium]|nr:polyribonucleotide nucleotidyltransferase [Chloroflexota bacterium]|tara:strand:- start:1434 stop:3497 length:2064 start_codon:yes stop_codon:yes gene_type:complete
MDKDKFDFLINGEKLSIEFGELAKSANGSVLLRYRDNVLLVTATMNDPRPGIDFFPLIVDFEEKLYARGKIPGGFFRREGRPSSQAILSARLIDRTLRPLFPEGFVNEVAIVILPLAVDLTCPLDWLAVVGANAALSLSDIPFNGQVAASNIAYVDNEMIVNPTYEQLDNSDFDLLVSGSKDGVVMIEAEGQEIDEDLMYKAIEKSQEINIDIMNNLDSFINKHGKDNVEFNYEFNESIYSELSSALKDQLKDVYKKDSTKSEKEDEIKEIINSYVESKNSEETYDNEIDQLKADVFRSITLDEKIRVDGRNFDQIRDLSGSVDLIPKVHGSGLFTRGETQVLSLVTLGSSRDYQRLDTLTPLEEKRFMLHYNFPPYSVGEARPMRSPGRREIGHGQLAEKALAQVLPDTDEFPYAIRIVAECLQSNGSTSMGTVCSATLALMDAGVPIKKPVAGISVGMISDNDKYDVMLDIQGIEDHYGDMDFKVAGTDTGITAIQLDIKKKFISMEVVRKALDIAQKGRSDILQTIDSVLPNPRESLKPDAPRISKYQIDVDKIGLLIGPGGKTIKGISEESGAVIDINDDGVVSVASEDGDSMELALEKIKLLTKEIKEGEIYTGKVVSIRDFGAFIELTPSKDGLLHISEIENKRVENVEDVLQIGDQVEVKVKGVTPDGKISLSRKALLKD